MRITVFLLATLMTFPMPVAVAQQSSEELQRRADESLAYARLIASHTLPTVTSSQCDNAQTAWLENDKADKADGPYWFQKMSTEEVARLASMATACARKARQRHLGAASAGVFISQQS